MRRCALGLDFGTESARAVLVDVTTGEEVGSAVHAYESGVIDDRLPETGEPLPPDWALQDPDDYWRALEAIVPAALRAAAISAEAVIGIGVDFTACTLIPTRADGTPLCCDPELRKQPHAWPKLWKHHGAKSQTERINAVARQRGETWLARYGGTIGLEWFFPKVLETLENAPDVYQSAEVWIEAGDWFV